MIDSTFTKRGKLRVVRPTFRQRLEQKFIVTPGCWLWTGYKEKKGYGRILKGPKTVMAHRASYELYVGPIPAGLIVCHACDTPACVNPDHLWVGTDQDNCDDKMAKGRGVSPGSKGSAHPLSRLTDEQVIAIRADHRTMPQIALAYGISYSNIYAIKRRKLWAHLAPMPGEATAPDGRVKPSKLPLDTQLAVRSDARSQCAIAKAFGISQSVVSKIKRGIDCYEHLSQT